jgi:hypothetical protein
MVLIRVKVEKTQNVFDVADFERRAALFAYRHALNHVERACDRFVFVLQNVCGLHMINPEAHHA